LETNISKRGDIEKTVIPKGLKSRGGRINQKKNRAEFVPTKRQGSEERKRETTSGRRDGKTSHSKGVRTAGGSRSTCEGRIRIKGGRPAGHRPDRRG